MLSNELEILDFKFEDALTLLTLSKQKSPKNRVCACLNFLLSLVCYPLEKHLISGHLLETITMLGCLSFGNMV